MHKTCSTLCLDRQRLHIYTLDDGVFPRPRHVGRGYRAARLVSSSQLLGASLASTMSVADTAYVPFSSPVRLSVSLFMHFAHLVV